MNKAKELSPEQFRRMQLTELDMLVEFDRVCRENNLAYVLFGGSLLGAIRHQGYIPWDDDADIGMLREDYDCFKKHLNELNPSICYFQDHDTDPEYRWGYGKLRRTGTKYIRVGQEHLKCKTGIFVDVFPMDDIPLCVFGYLNFHIKLTSLCIKLPPLSAGELSLHPVCEAASENDVCLRAQLIFFGAAEGLVIQKQLRPAKSAFLSLSDERLKLAFVYFVSVLIQIFPTR